MKTKTRIILTSTLAIIGLILSGTGIYLELTDHPLAKVEIKINYDTPIEQDLIITLKEIKLPINSSLSMDIQNYIEEPVENNILQSLVLNTTKVDMTKTGTYPYTITYKDQIFEGKIIVEENVVKESVIQEENNKLTLKNISLKLGEKLSEDINDYIVEQITDEMKQQIKLDTANVIINKQGSYQYTITYNGILYTGTIKIEENQKIESAKPEEKESKETEEKTEENSMS